MKNISTEFQRIFHNILKELCLELFPQENIEISLILQEAEPGAKLGAEDAMAVSNLAIAKESGLSGSLSGSMQSLNSLKPRGDSISSMSGVSRPGAVRSHLADNTNATTTTPTTTYAARAPLVAPSYYTPAADEADWWKQNKHWKDTHVRLFAKFKLTVYVRIFFIDFFFQVSDLIYSIYFHSDFGLVIVIGFWQCYIKFNN